MRVRTFREDDLPALLEVQRAAYRYDRSVIQDEATLIAWLSDVHNDARANAFVITDDDDELNTWGQAGTLEGIEGEIVGYTLLDVRHDAEGYHLRCLGTVDPAQRNRNAGRALLICALNRARYLAVDFEFTTEQEALPIYFEVMLPTRDAHTSQLAEKCELQRIERAEVEEGMQLYRRTL